MDEMLSSWPKLQRRSRSEDIYTHNCTQLPNSEKHSLHMENTHAQGVPLSNINNGISYILNLSELNKLHQKHKPLKLSIDYVMFINTESSKSPCPVDNCILTSNSLFDIYYFMNKNIHNNTLRLINNVNDFISLRLKKITIKVINDDRQSFISNFYSYFFN